MSLGKKMANMAFKPHPEPLPGYRFKVFVQGVPMGFSKITNLEESIETEPLQEGGVNGYVHSLRKPVSAERRLVMERGCAGRGLLMSMLTRRFKVGQRLSDDVMIMVFDRNRTARKLFLVHGGMVVKNSFSDLDASNGQLLIEHFELTYEYIEDYPMMLFPGIFY